MPKKVKVKLAFFLLDLELILILLYKVRSSVIIIKIFEFYVEIEP